MEHRDIVVIGASSGGIEALEALTRELPADLPASLFVVVHLAAFSPFLLPKLLNRHGRLMAVETQNGMTIQPGRIYVAPPDQHLLIRPGHVHLTRGPRENLSRPAVDPLFRTAAESYGRRVIGIILTGNLDDGSSGLLAVKQRGGVAIVQDPDDSRFPSMPLAALRYVKADYRMPLKELPSLIDRLVREELAPDLKEEPVDPQLSMEAKFPFLRILEKVETMDSIGTLAPYSCPECHGPLWRIRDNGPLRFRCHVGHGYTAESMQAAQVNSLEESLWGALRVLQEQAALLRELEGRAREVQQHQEADEWKQRTLSLEGNIKVIQNLLISRQGEKQAPAGP